MLIQFDVSVAHRLSILVRDFGHHLSGLVHEVVVDEPLAHKLLRELLLRFTLRKLLLIAISIEVAAGVGCVYFVNQIHLAVALAKLILRVHQNESLLSSNLGAQFEEGIGVFLHHLIVLLAHQSLSDDFLLRDVLVVTLVSLRSRCDDRLRELLVLLHALRQGDATQRAVTSLILSPCRASQVATDNHLHAETLALQSHRHHGVGRSQFPVRHDVSTCIEELRRNLIQHLSLERDALGQHHIECRDSVSSNHHHQVIVDVIHVTYFAVIHFLLSGEVKVCSC